MRDSDIVIIGAGIGGLTAALGLQQAGLRVRVYERSPQLGEVGAGLTVTPNASHVFHMLGMSDWIARVSNRPRAGVNRNWVTGNVIAHNTDREEVEAQCGAEYFQVHRADIHAELVARVQSNDADAILLDHSFTGLSQADDRVTAQFANGRSATGDALIAADGIRSEVRSQLFGAGSPEFTGYVAYRGLVPIDALPAGTIDYESCVFLGPGHLFLRYLIRQGKVVNFVCIGRANGWTEEGWSVRATREELLALLPGWHPQVHTIVSHAPADAIYKWGLFSRKPLERWTVGRATLLGDAAHPMLPFLGQGAVMAIEDGGIIARAFRESTSVPQALARYEAARRERANKVMVYSEEAGIRLVTQHPEFYTQQTHVSAGTLGLMDYNPRTVALESAA